MRSFAYYAFEESNLHLIIVIMISLMASIAAKITSSLTLFMVHPPEPMMVTN